MSGPPRLARWMLERALPLELRDHVPADLDELYARRLGAHGAGRARLWYWQQVFSFITRFRAEQLRDRNRTHMTTGISRTDLTLAIRMLVRYPGLTIVGVLGMAVGIAISAGAFAILYTFVDPALPLVEGDRIVQILNWDTAQNRAERRTVHDLVEWRRHLNSIHDVGAFRQVSRNLIAPGARPETVRITEMSASGFHVTRIAPLMGRHLVEADERRDAPPVLVIGADVWRNRFGGDPAIVGRTVQLGDLAHTIVGVMPDGYAFPVQDRFWVPFRAEAGQHEMRSGPSVTVFGRLAKGATFESAQAELATVGERAAMASPATHARLRPKVVPYTFPFFDIDDPGARWIVHLMQFLVSLLLVVVCVNVAILVYARTATRQAEIAVRSALGASRRRIVTQLFVEALGLTTAASLVGLLLTSLALKQVNAAMTQMYAGTPFWWTFELSSGLVAYVGALALLAAVIVGVLPALKATGRSVVTGLQQISAGGGGGMRLGRTWTILIVTQVAIAVALLPAAVYHAWDSVRLGFAETGEGASDVLTSQLLMDHHDQGLSDDAFAGRLAAAAADLTARLDAQPGVAAVAFSSSVPGGEPTAWIEVEGLQSPGAPGDEGGWVATGTRAGHEVRFNRVSLNYFATFGVPLLTGRGLESGDVAAGDPRKTSSGGAGSGAVVVNESFARTVLGGTALGRRVRYVGVSNDAEPGEVPVGRWYEVAGVISDFPVQQTDRETASAKLYHALPGAVNGATLSLRMRGAEAGVFGDRLREIAASVDPHLQVRNVATLEAVLRQDQAIMQIVAAVLGALTISVLALTSAGIYAMMAFTVAQRRKEIGIRAALGADPRRILAGIFSRALRQLLAGAGVGVVCAALLEVATDGGLMNGQGLVVLPIVAAVVLVVGLLAVLGPARRSLRIHPTEALRAQ